MQITTSQKFWLVSGCLKTDQIELFESILLVMKIDRVYSSHIYNLISAGIIGVWK